MFIFCHRAASVNRGTPQDDELYFGTKVSSLTPFRSAVQTNRTRQDVQDPIDISTDMASASEPTVLRQCFSVPYTFSVVFTRSMFAINNTSLLDVMAADEPAKCHRVLVFLDAGVNSAIDGLSPTIENWFEAHSSRLDLVTAPLVSSAGESVKSDWDALEPMRAAIRDHEIDRHSYIVAIGGGAMLDAVGLVAATAHRGIRHVRVPTTVLAQNDSGVGVKNGINQYGQKNYLGTFAPPWAVVNDSDFLEELGPRDRRSGMAEAVKVALIRDTCFFTWLEANAVSLAAFHKPAVEYLVRRCAELHMHQIAHGGDPFELGSARPLDFGHWAAHRLETLTDHRLRHGEAVAIGIALDTRYSALAGLLETGAEARVADLLEALGFTLWDDALDQMDTSGTSELIVGLEHFRTHLGGQLTITLLNEIGHGVEVHEIDSTKVADAVTWLRQRHTKTG